MVSYSEIEVETSRNGIELARGGGGGHTYCDHGLEGPVEFVDVSEDVLEALYGW